MTTIQSKIGRFGQTIRLVEKAGMYRVKVSPHKWSDPLVCEGMQFEEPARVIYSSHVKSAAVSIFEEAK